MMDSLLYASPYKATLKPEFAHLPYSLLVPSETPYTAFRFRAEAVHLGAAMGCFDVAPSSVYASTNLFEAVFVFKNREGAIKPCSFWTFGPREERWPNAFWRWVSAESSVERLREKEGYEGPILTPHKMLCGLYCLDNDPKFPYFFDAQNFAARNWNETLSAHQRLESYTDYVQNLERLGRRDWGLFFEEGGADSLTQVDVLAKRPNTIW